MCAAHVDEIGLVVGAMIDAPLAVAPGAPAMGSQWVADIRVEGPITGRLQVVLERAGVEAVTRLMTGIDGDIPEASLIDSLREVLAQAAAALALKPVARGATLSVAGIEKQQEQVPDGEWTAFAMSADKLASALAVTVASSLSTGAAVVNAPSAVQHALTPLPMPPAPATVVAGSDATDERIEVLLDIDLPLVVRFGRTELPLRQLTQLGPGSVIDLGRSPDDPVEVLVSNRVVARGEVVVVSGSYGVRILDVVSQRERVRSMEA
jgi:flagellar motor switch protein FliN/FliY